MQGAIVYLAGALLVVYWIRCALVYGHRKKEMPTGEGH